MESDGAEKARLLLKGMLYQILFPLDTHFSVPKTDQNRGSSSLPLISAITEHIDENLDKGSGAGSIGRGFPSLLYASVPVVQKGNRQHDPQLYCRTTPQPSRETADVHRQKHPLHRGRLRLSESEILFFSLQKQIRPDAEALPRREQGIIRP